MKTSARATTCGSVLLSAAVGAAILSILIAGVLSYLTNEYDLNYRSHRWNQAFHLAESAVEVGIAEYNYQYSLGGSGVGFQANGWSGSGGTYSKTVSNLLDTSGKVVGTIQVTASGIGASNPTFTGVGTVTSGNYGGPSLCRAVRVTLAGTGSLFPMAIVSKSAIPLSGNNYIDSYDSSDPTKSNNGLYIASKKQANGNIATVSTANNAVSMSGNADVNGTIATAPGGTVTMSANAQMGPTFSSPATSVAQGTANGWITHAFQTSIPDATVPATLSSASSVPGGQINFSANNTGTLSSGDWKATSLSLSGNSVYTISGTVRIYVTGNVSISGNAQMIITPGSSLTVYVGGASVSVSGNGVANNAVKPANNQWYGLPTSTSWTLSGNGSWVGTVYAPEAAFSNSGNGDMSGSVIASSVTMSGNGQFHYDESLKNSSGGAATSYNVASWQELRYVSGSWVP